MSKRLEKNNMTRFDYNVRIFSFIVAVLFLLSLAILNPISQQIVHDTRGNQTEIALLRVEHCLLKVEETIKETIALFR